MISRNTNDYDQIDAQFRANITDLESRYRRLERDLPEFIGQNDRIRDTLKKTNETFRIETTRQLSKTARSAARQRVDSAPSFDFSSNQSSFTNDRSEQSSQRNQIRFRDQQNRRDAKPNQSAAFDFPVVAKSVGRRVEPKSIHRIVSRQ